MTRRRILIVDNEDAFTLGMLRAIYSETDAYDILLAKSATAAQEIISQISIDLVVSEVHLPNVSGIDLLKWSIKRSPSTRVVLMTRKDPDSIRDQCYQLGAIQLLVKPFDIDRVYKQILELLDQRGTLGDLDEFPVADVIQMLCLSRRSIAVRVCSNEGKKKPYIIYIENGELVHAVCGRLSGEKVVYEMLRISSGTFSTLPLPENLKQTIKRGWQYLLIEGMRLKDENTEILTEDEHDDKQAIRSPERDGSRDLRSPARAEARRSISVNGQTSTRSGPISISSKIAALIVRGFDALRKGDQEQARELWLQAQQLDPDNRMIALNLRKLGVKNQ